MKDARRKTVNPATGRRVYITGVLGKRIRKEKKACRVLLLSVCVV